ncbi:MAG TPA: DapH/DapD/GlmU-related protein, partial [Vicinamibacterales bacterium]
LKVYIGSNILFARGVYLRSSNHVIDDRHCHILDQGHTSKCVRFDGADYAIVIEDECWIGANVVVLSGAHVGRGAVVAAGAVVTAVVPPYTIAAGVPAKVIAARP